jgi:hypothetical protein
MRIKRMGSLTLVVLMVLAFSLPLAADGGDEGEGGLFPVQMVLQPEEANQAPPDADEEGGGLFPVHMVLDPETLPPSQEPEEPGEDKAPGPQTRPAPALEAAWQTVKTENFEGAFPNQWSLRGNPTWDDEFDSGSHFAYDLAQWTGWCAGGGSAARTPGNLPGGAYAPNMNAWMIYGPFSLQGYSDAAVDFWYWLWTESVVDYVSWMASIDGVHFYGNGDSGNHKNWRNHTFDLKNVYVLGNLAGKPQVWVAFAFHSDSGLEYKGAYLDDILIKRKPNTAPTTGGVSPNSGGAACGTVQYFTTRYYDPDGYGDIKACRFHIGRDSAPKSLIGNAVFVYNPANNKIRVRNDAGTKWWGGKPAGSANLVQNGQAIVHCAQTTVTKNGNMVEVRWAIEFKCTFRGGKQLYLMTRDRNDVTTSLQHVGSWTVY